ncbi:MAG: class I SAM-dependent methyltransferase [Caulobacteraceae bacterium]|nr:class I SAM-dependent methyltransferase [Caulobacteraceae bacterium]
MNNGEGEADRTGAYVLGHSGGEIERLKAQARLIDPITRRILNEAGVVPGMRVLDVGSGAGDVAFLAADLVGPDGEVVGVDRASTAVDAARARAGERSLRNVRFLAGDPAEMTFERPFDAVIGRYVLQFQKDPARMLRRLADRARPGGLVVFHELDWGGPSSFPPAPTYDRCRRWGVETLRAHGTETRMGSKLHSTFVEAGLSPPSMRLEAPIGGGEKAADMLRLVSSLIATLLPEIERLGVATGVEIDVDTLFDRMQRESAEGSNVFFGHLQIGAWSRT